MARLTSLLLLLVLGITPMCIVNGQNGNNNSETYTGVALGTGGSAAGSSVGFTVKIDRYNSNQEVDQLAVLLKEKGQDALRREAEKGDVGRIFPVGGLGNQIAVARTRKVGADTVIRVWTARSMSFLELYRNNRSVDYPFGFLQLTLNDKGEGTGKFIGATKIRFDKKKGHYEIESYGNGYVKAVNVRRIK